jgi:hypothetical protein
VTQLPRLSVWQRQPLRRAAGLVLMAALAAAPLPRFNLGVTNAWDPSPQGPSYFAWHLHRDLQQELRYLLRLVERRPETAFATPIQSRRPDLGPALAFFGGPLDEPVIVEEALRTGQDRLRHPGLARLQGLRFDLYYGLSCAWFPACGGTDLTRGLTPREAVGWDAPGYTKGGEGPSPPFHFAVYAAGLEAEAWLERFRRTASGE